MWRVEIWEDENADCYGILSGIARRLGDTEKAFALTNAADGGFSDLLVIANHIKLPVRRHICTQAVIPGPIGLRDIGGLEAKTVATYGFSPKHTLTASSVMENVWSFALQREMPTLTGAIWEQQEFLLTARENAAPDTMMAIVAALLALSVPPEEMEWVLSQGERVPI